MDVLKRKRFDGVMYGIYNILLTFTVQICLLVTEG